MILLRDSLSVRSFLIAAMARYSGFFLLSLVTRFVCDIGQFAKIWIWVSSEVITICIWWVCECQSTSCILHSLLHRAEETQQGRNSCPRLQFGFQFGLYRVIAPLSFHRSISLASLFIGSWKYKARWSNVTRQWAVNNVNIERSRMQMLYFV